MTRILGVMTLILLPSALFADPPVAMYIFPAGGQRGKTVEIKVGGLFLHDQCGFEMLGPGITASPQLKRTSTLWIEGPILPLPDSQRQEDYPSDLAGQVKIKADAPLGERHWRVWTSQGVTPARRFVVGDLPEIIEKEVEGAPIPQRVQMPVTINGRIFPQEDVDIWTVSLSKGQSVTAVVEAARLGSPLDSRLEVRDPDGKIIAENDDAFGADSFLRFTAAVDGCYQVRIHDINYKGGQAYVYRLTLTADPYVDRVYPLGGQRGKLGSFQLSGQGLPAGPQAIDLPATATTPFLHRLSIGGKLTNPFPLDVDDLPEVLKDEAKGGGTVPTPGIANGRISKPGESDRWIFAAKKGELLDIELRAQRLGSLLTGVLVIEDAAGKVLARTEASSGGRIDPAIHFAPPADGTYTVVVSERFRTLGGPEYAYRLCLGRREEADFRLRTTADAITLPRGGQYSFQVQAELVGGFKQPITLTLEGIPADITVTGTTLAAGQSAATLNLKSTTTTKVRSVALSIRGTAKLGEKTLTRTASVIGAPGLESLRLAVGMPTPFKVSGKYEMGWASRGSVAKRVYKIQRNGYTGPLTVRLAERQARHLQGATGPTITVPPGATEFEYPVTLPPWMEIGRTCRVCVMALGEVQEPDGTKHTVSFSSVNQNEQLVAVIEAGYLDLSLEQTSLRAEPGKSVTLPVHVKRGKGLEGPVRINLVFPSHIRGVSATPVEVPANQSSATLTLRFDGENLGPFNLPLTMRATLTSKTGPITAEAKIEIAP
jgi:hypothetical protein